MKKVALESEPFTAAPALSYKPLTGRTWEATSATAALCSRVIESDDPCPASADITMTLCFPGASYMSIVFDDVTSLEGTQGVGVGLVLGIGGGG